MRTEGAGRDEITVLVAMLGRGDILIGAQPNENMDKSRNN
jgi:hypothetical protein